ncbi:MAG: hypothetical protein WAZ18_02625 [Alphaproteobacteria bacterium]
MSQPERIEALSVLHQAGEMGVNGTALSSQAQQYQAWADELLKSPIPAARQLGILLIHTAQDTRNVLTHMETLAKAANTPNTR